jgi:uncharacterized membrane-anchored protein YhcB (DUF1043 family)
MKAPHVIDDAVLAGISASLLNDYTHDFHRLAKHLTDLALGPCDVELTGDDRTMLLLVAALAREKADQEGQEAE